MNNNAFLLFHVYEYGDEDEHEITKLLGIYTTMENAEAALERYYRLPGFCNYPKDCFGIEKYICDKDMWWNDGFFKWGTLPDSIE